MQKIVSCSNLYQFIVYDLFSVIYCDVTHHLRVPCIPPSFPPGLKFGTGFSQRRSKGIEVIVVTSILLAAAGRGRWIFACVKSPREMDFEFSKSWILQGQVCDLKFIKIQVLWFFVLPFQITTVQHIELYTIVDIHLVFIFLRFVDMIDWKRKHHTPNRISAVLTIKRMAYLIINQPKLTPLPHCKARSLGNHASDGDGYKARHKGSSPATKHHIWPWVVSHNEASPGPGFGRFLLYKMVLGKMKKDPLKVKNGGCLCEGNNGCLGLWGNETLKTDWGLAT